MGRDLLVSVRVEYPVLSRHPHAPFRDSAELRHRHRIDGAVVIELSSVRGQHDLAFENLPAVEPKASAASVYLGGESRKSPRCADGGKAGRHGQLGGAGGVNTTAPDTPLNGAQGPGSENDRGAPKTTIGFDTDLKVFRSGKCWNDVMSPVAAAAIRAAAEWYAAIRLEPGGG
jgi:hypothetical protein